MSNEFVPVTIPEIEKAAVVWRFHDAPESLRALSENGGDEDWLALVPPHLASDWIPWAEVGGFGVCNVDRFAMPYGFVVYIGCHA